MSAGELKRERAMENGALLKMGVAEQNVLHDGILAFEYPAIPFLEENFRWPGYADGTEDRDAESSPQGFTPEASGTILTAEFEQRLADETRRSFEAGREHGRQEGHQAEREVQAAAVKKLEEERVRKGAELVANFARERDHYLQTVEHEVVKLALAIAARILRREAQMDPLLLTGAVRVALGQLAGTTEVRLRVPPSEFELWKDSIALLPGLSIKPEVIAGEGMRLGDCVIEASLGSVDLGIRSQLGEIEHGFFDRTGQAAPAAEGQPSSESGT